MQTVSSVDNLHEMSKSVFWEKQENYIQLYNFMGEKMSFFLLLFALFWKKVYSKKERIFPFWADHFSEGNGHAEKQTWSH